MHALAWRLIVLTCVLRLGACDRAPSSGAPGRGEPLIDVQIEVREADGVTRSATLVCDTPNRSTGYISREARVDACVQLLTTEEGQRLLRGEPQDEDDCRPASSPLRGGSATIIGKFEGDRSDRRVRVQTTCDESLWELLGPVFEVMNEDDV